MLHSHIAPVLDGLYMLSMSGICACSKKDKRHQLTFPFTHDFHSLLLARCEAVVRSADYFCNNRNYFLPIFLCPLGKENFVFLQRWIDQHLGILSMKTTITVTNNSPLHFTTYLDDQTKSFVITLELLPTYAMFLHQTNQISFC